MAARRNTVAIDTVPLPEKPLVGKVLKAGGKYFLQLKGRKLEIPVTPLSSDTQLAKFTGQEVNVALSARDGRSVVAIGTWPVPERPRWARRIIVCYIPVPDLFRDINNRAQELLLEQLAGR